VGDVARFADRNRFASWTGTAPIEASSGETVRHRRSRAGNRRMNHVLHIAAVTQLRLDTDGRAYYRRKLAAGNTRAEAIRCLKRRISDAVHRQLLADAVHRQLLADAKAAALQAENETTEQSIEEVGTGPGGHRGATHQSSAAVLPPHIDTSDQPLPGPAHPTLQPSKALRKDSRKKTPRNRQLKQR
jgi:transposase